ncbi:hypothetical protein SAMN04488136_13067 [Vibrio xiamenensis]|uniref:Integrating conjugative element membrane protein, PFL_4702 family n=1 Tax=Vibrio xiamenensis TaxID=861298 RepID=A0A1G8FHB5_9VIBR|nr:hypothetical protein [Vibrio xiamenensis]SDH81533.1 hypothetical protein SAMN04488136_13067 [Vibrio xiamenensis]
MITSIKNKSAKALTSLTALLYAGASQAYTIPAAPSLDVSANETNGFLVLEAILVQASKSGTLAAALIVLLISIVGVIWALVQVFTGRGTAGTLLAALAMGAVGITSVFYITGQITTIVS